MSGLTRIVILARRGRDRRRGEHGGGRKDRDGDLAMATSIRAVLKRQAARRVAPAALGGVVACVAGLVWRQYRLGGLELLDSRGWYTPGDAAALFGAARQTR